MKAYDPVAVPQARTILPEIEYASDEYDAVTGADALVLATEWNQFRALDMERIRELMHTPKMADLRNIYEPAAMREIGFDYVGVGRSAQGADRITSEQASQERLVALGAKAAIFGGAFNAQLVSETPKSMLRRDGDQ